VSALREKAHREMALSYLHQTECLGRGPLGPVRGSRPFHHRENFFSGIIEKLVPTARRVQFQRNSEALEALKEHRGDPFVQLDVFIFYMEGKDRNLKVLDFQPIDPSPIGLGIRKLGKMTRNGLSLPASRY
jgi:ABC-type amino acid transport substrate-binding protein